MQRGEAGGGRKVETTVRMQGDAAEALAGSDSAFARSRESGAIDQPWFLVICAYVSESCARFHTFLITSNQLAQATRTITLAAGCGQLRRCCHVKL